MDLSYLETKTLVYWSQTLLGGLMVAVAVYLSGLASADADPFVYLIPAAILFVVGIFCLIFGVETYMLRDDSDIWQ